MSEPGFLGRGMTRMRWGNRLWGAISSRLEALSASKALGAEAMAR